MTEAIKRLYTSAGLAAPTGKGIHTMRAHRCVVRYLKKGFAKNEAWQRCMGGLGRDRAVKKGHRR